MKAVVTQADPRRADREDGGKGWVLFNYSGPLLIWGVGGAVPELHQFGGCCQASKTMLKGAKLKAYIIHRN